MDKRITEISDPTNMAAVPGEVKQEEEDREIEYALAQITLKDMLNERLISLSEFDEITRENQCVFKPKLYEIMPCNR